MKIKPSLTYKTALLEHPEHTEIHIATMYGTYDTLCAMGLEGEGFTGVICLDTNGDGEPAPKVRTEVNCFRCVEIIKLCKKL